jgi:hypothetical protein
VPFVHAVPPGRIDPALKGFVTDPDLAGTAVLDAVGRFIEDCCVVGSGECVVGSGEWESSKDLVQAYGDWAADNGELPIPKK